MTAIILTRVLIKYHWIAAAKSDKTRMNCINAFFNDVMRGNGKAVLDFDAQEKCLKAALTRFEVPTDVPIGTRSDQAHSWQSQQQRGPQQKSGQTKQPPRKRNEARFNNNPLSFTFNDKGRTCANQSTATGCSPRPGINFAHVCSKWVPNKKDFCYGSHAEENHRWTGQVRSSTLPQCICPCRTKNGFNHTLFTNTALAAFTALCRRQQRPAWILSASLDFCTCFATNLK